jgi:hypothetical protein
MQFHECNIVAQSGCKMELSVLGLDPSAHIAILPCGLISLACGLVPVLQALRTRSPSLPPIASSETLEAALRGHGVRTTFLVLLGICNCARAAFYFMQYALEYGLIEQMMFVLPSVLFFSTFSVILKMWSEMVKREDDRVFGVGLVCVNVVVYAFITVLLVGIAAGGFGSLSFLRVALLFIGGCDLLAAVACVSIGVVLTKKILFGSFQGRNSRDALNDDRSKNMMRKLTWFWILSALVFLFRSAMCLSMGTLKWEEAVFSAIDPLTWQILSLTLTEWIPTLLLSMLVYTKPSGNITVVTDGAVQKVYKSLAPKEEYPYLLIDEEKECKEKIPENDHPTDFARSFVEPGEAG